jgi:hypothetical protein
VWALVLLAAAHLMQAVNWMLLLCHLLPHFPGSLHRHLLLLLLPAG